MIETISTSDAPAAIGPYSQAIKCGSLVFVSGQLPINPVTGDIDSKDIKGQAKQCIENISEILKAANSDVASVLKTTCYLTDMQLFGSFNEVYSTYFSQSPPSRECIAAKELPKNALVEISAIAYCS